MPVYEFKCKSCSMTILDTDIHLHVNAPCVSCGGPLKKVFAVNLPGPNAIFEPHYNNAVGAYVSSWSDFEAKLRRRQERQVEITGIDHSYTPVHPADMKPQNLGVTEEGLDNSRYDPSSKKVFS